MQVNDFRNMRWGSIMPTDIDAFLDFKNQLFVIVELKHGGAALPFGQMLALERLCDGLTSAPSYVLIARHEHKADEDIDVSAAIVTDVRKAGVWYKTKTSITVKAAIDILINIHVSSMR